MSTSVNVKDEGGEHFWVPLADMMTGLMMVFLFISVGYMFVANERNKIEIQARQEAEASERRALDAERRVHQIAADYARLQQQLYEDLENEFRDDLPRWNAMIERKTLSVRFKEPNVLFDSGEATLKPLFKVILDDFFPRYIAILTGPKYRDDIEELRIEGHTSSDWITAAEPMQAYFLNMELSQNRTRSVLQYVMNLPSIAHEREWIRQVMTANGLSSSKPVMVDGFEDPVQSRRVEFKVRTKAEARIGQILERNEAHDAT